ncbi:lysophospholipid acyltransferase family protein [Pseudopedobacter beijingensis]|uniref:Lysophospholipid acyltransferase family protein n=1 Tax=Pseudopedobacter beijingensis TaxID=1207056 RepID=A0ABW4IGP0_9SPHI
MINKWLSNAAAFFLYLISLLPLSVLYLFSDAAYFLVFHVFKYRRHVVFLNIKNSFPDKSEEELRAVEKKFYQYLTDLVFETIKMLSASPKYIYKRFKFINLELFREFEQKNQNFLVAVGHYGNWEWCAIVTGMITTAKPLIIYKSLQNKTFDAIFKKTREKSGSEMVEMANTYRKIVAYKNELNFTVFAGDQRPTARGSYVWMPFLNQPTPVFTGIEKIAKSTNYPVVYCDVSVPKRGYYQAEFRLITDNPQATEDLEITNSYIRLLEEKITQTPEYWLWSHKRWKIKPGEI